MVRMLQWRGDNQALTLVSISAGKERSSSTSRAGRRLTNGGGRRRCLRKPTASTSDRKVLDTTVRGVQTAITVFLLVMAALMIPGGKLTDRWGRKRCFTLGLTGYGIGAMISA